MGGYPWSPVDQIRSAWRTAGVPRGAQDARTPRQEGLSVRVTVADVPRLVRGLALLATGLEIVLTSGRPGAAPPDPCPAVRAPRRLTARLAALQDGRTALATPHTPGRATATVRQARDAAKQALTTVTAQVAAVPALQRVQTRGGARRVLLVGVLSGGLLALLLSPLRAQVWTLVRGTWSGGDEHGAGGLIQTARRSTARASGRARQVLRRTSENPEGLDDATLVDRVESEIFRDPAVPKGRLNINAEQGRVVLRGQVDQPEQISALDAAVRQVPGVRDVENLLHLPGTPAPQS